MVLLVVSTMNGAEVIYFTGAISVLENGLMCWKTPWLTVGAETMGVLL